MARGGSAEAARIVASYLAHYRLSQGDRQERRTAADHHFWAVEAVMAAVESLDAGLLWLLDSLVEVPEADSAYLAYVAAGPVEDILNQDPARWDLPLADRCRLSPRWREVLRGVDLQSPQHAVLRSLAPYLRPLPSDRG